MMVPGLNGAAWSAYLSKNKVKPLERISEIQVAKQLYESVSHGKSERVQLFFDSSVLNQYREIDGFKIIRTDSSGRVSRTGSWNVDFGISGEEDSLIHISVESFLHRIPESERDHWVEFMVTLPVSRNFLKGIVRPGCLDDGMIRNW
jgi:hypothetical protein